MSLTYIMLMAVIYAAAIIIGIQLFHYCKRWLPTKYPQWTKNLAYCIPLITFSFASFAQTFVSAVNSL